MAKKRTGMKGTAGTKPKTAPAPKKGQLGDWLDEVPEEVQAAADAYETAHKAKAKAVGKFNTARDNVIEKMKETGTKRVPIRNGEKFLRLDEQDVVKIEKRKDAEE